MKWFSYPLKTPITFDLLKPNIALYMFEKSANLYKNTVELI